MYRCQIGVSVVFFLILSLSGTGQVDVPNIYNKHYEVGEIPGIDDFNVLNQKEKQIDSLIRQSEILTDSIMKEKKPGKDFPEKRDFKNNRSRLSLEVYRNGTLSPSDSALNRGLPAQCSCFMVDDTIYIKTFLGFFGGVGVNIKITGKKIDGGVFVFADDVKPYKSAPSDTAFQMFVAPDTKYQYMVLDKNPEYKQGEQITGLYKFASEDFYEKKHQGSLDSISIKGSLIFTCTVKSKM